jgi:putative aldouronate transport system substrate-binding protein
MPTTPDELLDTAIKFMKGDPNGNGKADEIGIGFYGTQYRELSRIFDLHYVTGAGWTEKDGRIIYEPLTDQYREFMRFLNKCVSAGVFPADWLSVDSATGTARKVNGLVGITTRDSVTNVISWQDPSNSMKKTQPDARWVIIPPLNGPYGKGNINKSPIASIWRTVSVTSANKYPEETVKWLDWAIFSEEASILNHFGIEGKSYEMVDGKVRVITDSPLQGNKPLADGTWLGYRYLPRIQTSEMEEAGFASLNLPEDNYGLQSLRAIVPLVEEPFTPPIPTVEEGAQISALMADITTYVDEALVRFMQGALDVDRDWDKYIADLKSIGVDTVIGLYQKQYDNLKSKTL